MTACHPARGRSLLRRGALCLACAAACGSAAAQADDAFRFTFHSTLSVGVGMRTSKPRCDFIGQDNGGCASTGPVEMAARYPTQFSQTYDQLRINQDDGDLDYRRGRPFSETLHGLHELLVEGRDGWSGLLRGTWTYDAAADRTARTPLERDARRQATHDARFLDAYVTKDFEIGERSARLRVGNQVLNWGDSTFIPGGINSINAIDITKTHAPGAQIKEIALPAPMAMLNLKLARGLGLESYVQWGWNAMRLDPVGTFFSTSDVAGRGSSGIYLPTSLANQVFAALGQPQAPAGSTGDPGTRVGGARRFTPAELADPATSPLFGALGTGSFVARGGDVAASNRGQFGAALRWTLPESGDELGFYAFRYHDKVPSFDIRVNQAQATNPFAWDAIYGRYVEKKTLVGASYGTRVADWTLGTELSYRPRETVLIDPTMVLDAGNPYYCNGDLNPANYRPTGYVCSGSIQTRKWQAHLTATNLMTPDGSFGGLMRLLGASEGTFITELAVAHYPSLKFDAGVPYAVTNDDRQPTRTAAGFVAQLSLTYPAAFGTRATFAPDLTYSRGVHGIAASPLPGFVQGAGALTAGLTTDFKTHPALRLRVDYTRNHGGGPSNPLRDRDFASASLTTEF
jgi:hypothetical protein